MCAVELDRLTWPEIRAEQERGRDTVVVAFGATEQHGPHMPLATDALLGDHLARMVAESLDAFLAPTVRIGCSEHHLEFPGTLSLSDATFHGIVADIVRSLARGGFARVVLLPTHGGNFGPLATALELLGPVPGIEVRALTDLGALFTIAQLGADEHGVPLGEGGVHAGEWETSMLMAIHPELVHPDRGEPGYTGDPQAAVGAIFGEGVHTLAPNGVIGDPSRASAEHGRRYWDEVLRVTLAAIA
ncbi:MAG TPA: creatininase family protein [Solirubrobacteraceae bacterium]|jgi:creatinine amidohydrolase|nr:creatininase family protein [Solirubrobacteraceae bacterium]